MKITELLTKNTINLNINGTQKLDVVEELVTVLDHAGKLADKAEYKKAILARA